MGVWTEEEGNRAGGRGEGAEGVEEEDGGGGRGRVGARGAGLSKVPDTKIRSLFRDKRNTLHVEMHQSHV